MSDFVYKDYLPANARVVIDYTKEQKVGFSYPIEWTYWKAVWKRAYPTVVAWWLSLHYIPITFLGSIFFFLGIPAFIIYSIFFPREIIVKGYTHEFGFWSHGFPVILLLFWLLSIPLIITLILASKKERLSKWLPNMGYWAGSLTYGTKEKIFQKKDVIENKIIIHNFSNVFLNYKTQGDFHDCLTKVEILEIPFNYKTRRFLIPWMKKKEKNDFFFRAVFYFSKTPTNGSMEVEFI